MNHTVLIAEGDPELSSVFWRFLTERGYLAQTAADGLDCLEKLRRRPPGVLVLDPELRWGSGVGALAWLRDVSLPGRFRGPRRSGGAGVLTWLRDEGPLPAVPVILTPRTGYPRNVAEFLEPPVVHCLPKPFALTALRESVLSALTLGQRAVHEEDRIFAPSEPFAG
jgi:CheY-like chemotaxis protein